jgi:hypothetical protein
MTCSISVAETTIERGRDDRVTVTVCDDDGNVVAGVFCAFAIVSQPDTDARLETSFGTTDADGQVATTLHVGDTTGTIQLQARCGEITMEASVHVVGTPPASLPDTGTGDALTGASRAGVVLGLLLVLAFSLGLPAAYSIHRHGRRL